MDKRMSRISELLLKVMNKIVANEKTAKDFGLDVLLHPSEIHMVMFIGNNKNVHISELARIVGITRGAVSQTVYKLEKKGLVNKMEDPINCLKTVPALTDKGWNAYWAHEQHHEKMDAELYVFMKELTEKEIALIKKFLHHLEAMADKRH